MEYYKLLRLDREPFSNSPDPEYFFNSRQHMGCLQKLELALRLKRGLNVVIGDVGTGKTTLCRQLIRKFADEPEIETHLILDPTFDTPLEFLKTVAEMVGTLPIPPEASQAEMKEMIKKSLFHSGVDENKTIVLIIDEGQKISDPCLEILRELLNYETNTYKLLQIVIFAQLEFNTILQNHANFTDRINLLHHLKPLHFRDTKQLIQHRLNLSSATTKPIALFTLPALWAIYRSSRGYPRKIIHLCHQSMLALIIQNRTKAGWALIQSCKNRLSVSISRKRNIIWITSLTWLLALIIMVSFPIFHYRHKPITHPNAYKIHSSHVTPPDANVTRAGAQPIEAAPRDTGSPPRPAVPQAVAHSAARVDSDYSPTTRATPAALISPTPPELLGQLPVKPGDTLSALILEVYGFFHRTILQSVIATNAHIQNPDDIEIGNTILFPTRVQKPAMPKAPFFLVVLDEHDTLPLAIQGLKDMESRLGSKPKLVAIWSPTRGLRFQIIQKTYFHTRQAARDHIDLIPFAIATRSKIMPGWPEDTVFYSNPFEDGAPLSYKGEG